MRILLAPEAGRATLAPPTCISGRSRCLLLSCGAIWAFVAPFRASEKYGESDHTPKRGHVARVWAYDAQWLMSYDHKRHNM